MRLCGLEKDECADSPLKNGRAYTQNEQHGDYNDISAPNISPRHEVPFWTSSKDFFSTKVSSSGFVDQLTRTKYSYPGLTTWINSFSFVSSEPEFNHDSSSTPRPANVALSIIHSSSPSIYSNPNTSFLESGFTYSTSSYPFLMLLEYLRKPPPIFLTTILPVPITEIRQIYSRLESLSACTDQDVMPLIMIMNKCTVKVSTVPRRKV